MSDPTTATVPPNPPDGREPDGRFARGNRGGPGNPFARKCAAFRAALMEALTDQDIKDIATKLRDDARAGDKAAAKLLFQYAIGRPQPAVNPDTLDYDEFRNLHQSAVPGEAVGALMDSPELPFWLETVPLMMESQTRKAAAKISRACSRADERDRRRAERAERKAERRRQRAALAAPSTNGTIGVAVAGGPSTNGEIGGSSLLDDFTDWLRDRRHGLNG
jgi:hypothetical protein